MKRSYLEISTSKLRHNYEFFQTNSQKKIMAVVKANAYGHGMTIVSHELYALGCRFFAVATLQEGLDLRHQFDDIEILLLGRIEATDIAACVYHHLTISLTSLDDFNVLKETSFRGILKVHIKIDTGLNRWGISPMELPFLVNEFLKHPQLILEGIYTHYIGGEADQEKVHEQFRIFETAVRGIQYKPKWIHASSSFSSLFLKESFTNMIRLGLGLYGLIDHPHINPILSLKSPILRSKTVQLGEGVSYHHQESIPEPGYLYTLPIGYGDGWSRAYHTFAVDELGHHLPIVGLITMDSLMVFSQRYLAPGKELELIGPHQSIAHLAEHFNLSPYEIVTRFSPRLERRLGD